MILLHEICINSIRNSIYCNRIYRAVLPLLPTTPFLILAAICFTNSSRKFKIWLESTQIYKNYVENLKIQRVYYERKNKNTYKFIYCSWFSIFMISNLYIRIGLMIMVVIQTIVLFTFVKTLPANFNQEKDS